MKNACIIGAGSSGITAAKALKEKGLTFDCYEKGSKIGGNWRYQNDNGMSSAYRSLHINTNRMVMAYTDYPMPDHYPMFPHHSHIITYFENYVKHFDLGDNIHFNTEVLDVKRNENGTYRVKTNYGEADYESVIVCNGHHWNPRFPEPGFDGYFSGDTLHSHNYKEPSQIANKDLLIVGIGNSAVDIACEAARQYTGNKVVISTRSGAHIVPNWIWSIPFDSLANPFLTKLPLAVQRFFLGLSLRLARGRQEDFGVPKPKNKLLSEHPTLSQDLLNLSGRGLIKFKPNVKGFLGNLVRFEDRTEEKFDMIIYATGYKVTFPFLKDAVFHVENSNDFQLYKKVIHPEYPNLFFVGLLQPLGAIMPLAEIQSKWIAKLLKGESSLPSKETMQQDIEKESIAMQKRYKNSPRHTLQVDFYPYKEAVEKEMKRG